MVKQSRRRKDRKSQTQEVINKLRGGFGNLGKTALREGLKYGKPYADRALSKAADYAERELNRRFGEGLGRIAGTALGAGKQKLGEYVEKIAAVHPETGSVKLTSGEPVIDIATGSKRVKVDFQGPVKSRTFVENFSMGEKSSKSLLRSASQNGTKTLVLFDTMNDSDMKDPTKAPREYLEMVTGFNQKLVYTHKRLTPAWRDIFENIYKIGFDTTASTNPDTQVRTVDYNIYGGALWVSNRLRFRNNMTTTSAKIKVHIIALKEATNSASMTFMNPIKTIGTINTTANDTTQYMDSNKIIGTANDYPRPNYKNASNVWAYNATSDTAYYSLLTPTARITDSPVFTNRYKIVKTFAKTLDVGDELVLNIQNSFGSGLRLDRILALKSELAAYTADESKNWSFPYYVVVELMGPTVTAETATAGNFEDKFLGTAPCSVNFESKQTVKYVLESNSGVPTGSLSALTESDFASRFGQPLIRYYVKDEVVAATPYNVGYENAVGPNSPTIIIKSVTDSSTQVSATVT